MDVQEGNLGRHTRLRVKSRDIAYIATIHWRKLKSSSVFIRSKPVLDGYISSTTRNSYFPAVVVIFQSASGCQRSDSLSSLGKDRQKNDIVLLFEEPTTVHVPAVGGTLAFI